MTDQNTTLLQSSNPSLEDNSVAAKPLLRLIPEGENFSTAEEVRGDKVRAVFALRRHKNGPRYEKVVDYDFSGVTREQLILLSLYHVKVWTQRVLRATSPEDMLNPQTLSSVDVLQDIVQGVRRSGDPVGAAFRTLARQFGITEEKAREIFHGVVTQEQQDEPGDNT